jgi:hypothetical protein
MVKDTTRSRSTAWLWVMPLLALILTAALAQSSIAQGPPPPPVQTATPGPTLQGPPITPGTIDAPPGVTPGVPPVIITTTPDASIPTIDPAFTEDPTEEAGAETTPEPIDDAALLALNVRSDLELLANALLEGSRPDGWSGSSDLTDPQIGLLARLDLETLAVVQLGEQRPDDWFGAVPSSLYAIARDVRHDLELLADTLLGAGQRPIGWIGGPPIMRCDRSTQALVDLLTLNGLFNLTADPAAPDFCAQAAVEASVFTEQTLLANPFTNGSLLAPESQSAPTDAIVNSDFAVAFFDRSALERAGVIPNGTPFQPLGRSPVQFSNMMLISGEGFTLFVDYQATSVTTEQYEALTNVDTINVELFCAAEWCGAAG